MQSYGAEHTDAALLQLAQVGFLPSDDPRILSTLAAIRAELEIAPGLLRRYRTERTDDGVAGDEHAFLACSFWLADALARTDDVEGSTEVLDILVGLANDVGLLAEQYDPVGRRMAGQHAAGAVPPGARPRGAQPRPGPRAADPMTYTGDVQVGGPRRSGCSTSSRSARPRSARWTTTPTC